MIDTKKFGAYISGLRKSRDLTQIDVARYLNISRQAVSKYERGESFPDISVLILISELFLISIDEIITESNLTSTKDDILYKLTSDSSEDLSFNKIKSLAPYLKPSSLSKIAKRLKKDGIHIDNLIFLAEFIDSNEIDNLLDKSDIEIINENFLHRFIPFLNDSSKRKIYTKILSGKLDWKLLEIILPYMDYILQEIECAVIDGALPKEVLEITSQYTNRNTEKNDIY